jgi:hypothetical protein
LSESIQTTPKLNTMAIVAFVASFFISVAGVILGHIALNKIKTSGERGRVLAIWALVLGYAGVAVFAIIVIGGIAAASMSADMGM